jgi:hypothetical protein
MPPELRAILSIFVGIIAGFFTVSGLETLSPWQPPAGVDPTSGIPYGRWVESLPTAAHQMYLGFFLISGLVGGFITQLIARGTRYYLAWVTGFILIVLSVGKFMAYNHPEWLTYAICIGYMVAAWAGGRLVRWVPATR